MSLIFTEQCPRCSTGAQAVKPTAHISLLPTLANTSKKGTYLKIG